MTWFGVLSYGIAALAYGATALMLVVNRRSGFLALAVVSSSLWAAGAALVLLLREDLPIALVGIDALHVLAWVACALSWLRPRSAVRPFAAIAAAIGLWVLLAVSEPLLRARLGWTVYPALVLLTLIGFLGVEQVFRNVADDQHRQLKLLCLAAGGVFAIDLFVYSQATVLDGVEPLSWQVRGLASTALLPLVVLGTRRHAEWERELFVSRQVVFYTASLLAVGGYLVAMGLVAYVIRAFGGRWSLLVQISFLAAAAIVLFVALFSTSIRARLKVLVVKHFYRNKYDYRDEWLRLTRRLGRTGDLSVVATNALEGLAGIIDSNAGQLWLERDAQRYDPIASFGDVPTAPPSYDKAHALPSFLASTGWVIDSEEYVREPGRYGTDFGEVQWAARYLVVPLDLQGHLQGFVALAKPPELHSLNFEDHDILKTAGKQVASALAQALAQEQLTETRQFEAMNRLTAFLMHDLKNVVAQQELVVSNAQRFRHRPEFVDDAFATIRSSLERMKRVLSQLSRPAHAHSGSGRVDVSKVLMEVRSHCADRQPVPELQLGGSVAWVNMDREELFSALTHLVRNAQDATPPDGRIAVDLENGGSELSITVTDNGCGMDPEFMRERLFRPFDSTKGAGGMGIGAYQVRHLVRAAGGDVEVRSDRGVGTTFTLRLPRADRATASA